MLIVLDKYKQNLSMEAIMENNDFNSNTIINELQNETIATENSKKENTKKIIIKTIVIVLASFIAFFALVWGIVIFTGDGNSSSSTVRRIDDNWVEFLNGENKDVYGLKKTPNEFIDTVKEIMKNYYIEMDAGTDAIDIVNSLTYYNKREYENHARYYYTFPISNNTIGYFIDYDGTYILEVGLTAAATDDNLENIDSIVSSIFTWTPIILNTYGLETITIDELKNKILKEIDDKRIFTEQSCKYKDYVISYSPYVKNTIGHISVFRANNKRLKEYEKAVGYTLVDVSETSSW